MQHIWTALCQFTSEDKKSGALSLINVLDTVQIAVDPAIATLDDVVLPIDYYLVSRWLCGESSRRDEAIGQVKLYSPESEHLGDINFTLSAIDAVFAHLNQKISGIPYKGEGVYIFKVFHVLDERAVELQQIPVLLKLKSTVESEITD